MRTEGLSGAGGLLLRWNPLFSLPVQGSLHYSDQTQTHRPKHAVTCSAAGPRAQDKGKAQPAWGEEPGTVVLLTPVPSANTSCY